MKSILVLTNIYPCSDLPKGYTPVVHYFVREWVKMGYNIRVINYDVNFPSLYYKLTRCINNRIASKTGSVVKKSATKDKIYQLEGVNVYRISVKKLIPHSLCSNKEIDKAYKKSIEYLKNESFLPDIVISHWANPCVLLMSMFKEKFKVPTCYVAHGVNELCVFGPKTQKLLESIDIIGCRSEHIKKGIKLKYKTDIPMFNCYSGIPEEYVNVDKIKNINDIRNFIYVGTLIKRKYPATIIPALKRAYHNEKFIMNYVGEGNEREAILKISQSNGVAENIVLHGRLQRNQVVELLDKNEVFIMISKNETFGLVYLEAMARGCITIASRNEGFDGIIQDGVNGFLCEAGNSDELYNVICKIRSLSKEKIQKISTNAQYTAHNLTDTNAANMYLKNLNKLLQ